ncbi:MAG TPA: hypothetical protein VLB68_16320 [Pyrinomonadaceae bacterium]|nr:hypothetical protein [Pyrinomonadaceae bacterium]
MSSDRSDSLANRRLDFLSLILLVSLLSGCGIVTARIYNHAAYRVIIKAKSEAAIKDFDQT